MKHATFYVALTLDGRELDPFRAPGYSRAQTRFVMVTDFAAGAIRSHNDEQIEFQKALGRWVFNGLAVYPTLTAEKPVLLNQFRRTVELSPGETARFSAGSVAVAQRLSARARR